MLNSRFSGKFADLAKKVLENDDSSTIDPNNPVFSKDDYHTENKFQENSKNIGTYNEATEISDVESSEDETWKKGTWKGFTRSSRYSRSGNEKESIPLNDSYQKKRRVALTPARATVRKTVLKRLRKIAEERLTVKQIFKRYVESSTLHGFRYTCSNTYVIRRFIWACLMLLGAVYFIIKLKEGIIEYFEYPFSTLSIVEYVEKLKFPAISFCVVNGFNSSRVRNSKLMKLYNRLPLERNWQDPGYDIPGDELIKLLNETSCSIEDILEDCEWIKRDTSHPFIEMNFCGSVNFTSFFNNRGQLCYTLNSGKKGHRLLEVDHEGLIYGYELLFDLKIKEAVKSFQFSGIEVIIHDQSETPVMSNGFVISSGFRTFVRMNTQETKNLPPPYGTKCGEKTLKYHSNYNQKSCLLELLTDYTGEKCGCREAFMPDNRLPYCSLKEIIMCVFPAKESFNEYEMRQLCPVDCQTTIYTTELSDARFLHNPPTGIEPTLMKEVAARKNLTSTHLMRLAKELTTKELDQYIEHNLVNVLFFFGEMKKDIQEQEASFDFYQFLGDMGGEIGLMLGASLLTFVEFMDLFIFLIYHQLLRFHQNKN